MKNFSVHISGRIKSLTILIPIVFALSGCVTTPTPNVAVERARTAFENAQSNPRIVEHSPVALYESRQALEQAEQTQDISEATHLAYIAERKAQLAAEVSATKTSQERMAQLGQEREQILLEAREQDADRARQRAQREREQAEQARQQAEEARRKAEMARQESEESFQQAERARQEAEQARREAELALLKAQEEREKALRAEQDAQTLQRELEELKARPTDRGYVLTLGDILFETGKAEILPGAMVNITRLAEFLQKHQDRNIIVEGHTDSVGSAEFNLGLSQRRADSVQRALVAHGVSVDRILSRGYGLDFPVASNNTDAGRQQNRRVEVVILDEGQDPATMLRK